MNRVLQCVSAGGLTWLAACGGADPDATGVWVDGAVRSDGGIAPVDGAALFDGASPPLPPVVGGDGAAPPPGSCAGINAVAEARLLPVDIVWAIDDSGSMAPSFPAIQSALTRFSSDVTAAGIDAHIVVLAGQGICVPAPLGSGQCGLGGGGLGLPVPAPDTKLPNFLHLSVSFGYSAGMGVILDNYASYRDMLRPGARTHLVLTEDGAPPMSADAVTAHVEGRAGATASGPWSPGLRAGEWTFNGVVCVNGISGATCLTAFQVPTTTLALIAQTGGVSADLAQAGQAGADPFASLLQALAMKVIVGAELSCEYDIPAAPSGETFDRDRVNVRYGAAGQANKLVPRVDGACNDALAWTYDDPAAPSKIVLCPAACSEARALQGGSLGVEFGCETTILR